MTRRPNHIAPPRRANVPSKSGERERIARAPHSQKWRCCPVCRLKLRTHRDAEEFWCVGGKQLVHRRKCARRYRRWLREAA